MGRFTEQGKEFELFSSEFPYKVKLLYGDRVVFDIGEPYEQITYYCKAHGETYRIRNSFDKFFCDNYVLDESDLYDAVPELYDSILDLTMEHIHEAKMPYSKLLQKLNKLHTNNSKDISTRVRMRCRGNAIHRIKEYLNGQLIQTCNDGSSIMGIHIAEKE